jgi:hypothetical protein
MAETIYSYVAADFAGSKLNPTRLALEIAASAILTALERIDTTGGVLSHGAVISPTGVDIVFKAALSAGDKTLLDGDATGPAGGLIVASDNSDTDPEVAYDDDGHQIVAMSGGTTQIGMQAMQVLNTPDISSDMIKSWQVTAAAQTTEIMDIYIGDDLVGSTGRCYLAGGEYRCRTDVAEGSALNFHIVDRNDVLGAFTPYGLSRTKLSTLTAFAGGTLADDVNVGEYAHGDTSGAKTKILAKGADFLEVQFHETGFTDGEAVTFKDDAGAATGVTCTLGTWDEGDVLEVQTSVKDEWVEGFDIRDVHPGGSKEVPEGMYFRVKFYNNHADTAARIKVSLTVGKL